MCFVPMSATSPLSRLSAFRIFFCSAKGQIFGGRKFVVVGGESVGRCRLHARVWSGRGSMVGERARTISTSTRHKVSCESCEPRRVGAAAAAAAAASRCPPGAARRPGRCEKSQLRPRARAVHTRGALARDVTPRPRGNDVTSRDLNSCSCGRETETDDRVTPSGEQPSTYTSISLSFRAF